MERPTGVPVQNKPPIMDGVGRPPERPTPTTGSIKPPPIMDGVGQPPEKPETANPMTKPAFENGKGPIKVPTGPTTKPGRPEKEPAPMESPTPFNPITPPERPNPGTPPERPTRARRRSGRTRTLPERPNPGTPPERPGPASRRVAESRRAAGAAEPRHAADTNPGAPPERRIPGKPPERPNRKPPERPSPGTPPERPNPGTPPERPTPTTAGSSGKPPRGRRESRCNAAGAADARQPATTYNCYTRESWSPEKKDWCCKNKKLGCPTTTRPPMLMACRRRRRSRKR